MNVYTIIAACCLIFQFAFIAFLAYAKDRDITGTQHAIGGMIGLFWWIDSWVLALYVIVQTLKL